MSTTQNDYLCSFCSKPQAQVKRLIAGPDRVFICDECVELCQQIISEETPEDIDDLDNPVEKGVTPKFIYDKLEEYVIGQEKAKKILSVAVYNHYKRVWSNKHSDEKIELQKANILMYGPSGSGKTHLAQTLAKILDVPFAIVDATSITEAGYVGEDVENILLRLIQAADYDISKAEHGIIYIDEIDKITRKSPNPSITRDVSGEGVQQALLKIIEGCLANVPPQGGRKHPHQEFMQIKTDDILFMVGGAFEGMTELLMKRVNKDNYSLGFKQTTNNDEGNRSVTDSVRHQLNPDDLMEFGFITEFVGRLPVLVTLDELTKDDLVRILTEPKNAFVDQYKALFRMEKVNLNFSGESLVATAEKAIEQKTGARGLRTILESTLMEVMFELPSMSGITHCDVEAEAIIGDAPVKLSNDSSEIIELATLEKKSA
ncbi:MAG: ATP-dependent Clp protease ATP-binding subunit ClpX [SAR202 cluster bacterium]|mgnify:FL=1|jgi:ATP-dependent Clp protease ATP-binding subunit ClpX|nr:ATP-dependent Clp protease ATP-binding subunit ClpX [SAR202 cluster bacterium]|tara:strand:- start:1731 stop:3023 length:1293 start_codon:yes stop_codon:yes gene_type:complete